MAAPESFGYDGARWAGRGAAVSRGVRKGSTNPAQCGPPKGKQTLRIRLVEEGRNTERTISSLDDATFQWLGRVWLAESARRVALKERVTHAR